MCLGNYKSLILLEHGTQVQECGGNLSEALQIQIYVTKKVFFVSADNYVYLLSS